ncbi:MAG: amino acid carrier protein [Lachnospiraceae bacterium]|nr:amino acid carrier protein [Ruminococcus sp.]MCM1276182.1 amino acid carrier protein [Lachnospiraceae bacterium]
MIFIRVISFINDNIVWGAPMLCLMLFTGVLFTVKTGFFQLRKFPVILRSTVFSKPDSRDANSVSPFAAMCQALAATLGTGNIAGVSTALAVGGAGAVFWMWISALFGMMTGFAENVLGTLYRRRENGEYKGGAMLYIRDGLSESPKTRPLAKPLSALFAALCVLAGFGMGNAAQMNSASEALRTSFGVPPLVTGIVLAALAAVIVFGGVKRISAFTAKLVPLMSAFYIIGSLYIIISSANELPAVLENIVKSAFGIKQLGGGIAGAAVKTAVSMGFKRGVFSNEAGLGTSVFAHISSGVKSPVICGMWSVFEIFFDTIVMCSLTALVLLTSGCRAEKLDITDVTAKTQYFRLTESDSLITDGVELNGSITHSNIAAVTGVADDSGRIIAARIEPLNGVGLASYAFSAKFGKPAGAVLSVLVVMFAFSTVIGWCYFGGEAVSFLFGDRAKKPFCAAFIAFSVVGATFNMSVAWGVSDMLNGLMALPNLFAVLCLRKKVFAEVKKFARK